MTVSTSDSSVATGERSSRADTALLAVGCAYGLAIGVTPLYGVAFNDPLPASPPYALSVLLSVLIGTLLALTLWRERVDALRPALESGGDSFWNELSLVGFTYLFTVVCVGILLTVADSVLPVPDALETVATHLGGVGIALALVARRRRDRLQYPDWLEIESWNVWGYLALFGSVFFLTYASLTPAFGPAGGALPVVSLLTASGAVVARAHGAR